MAFTNSQGIQVSFDCSKLIRALKSDITEFGGDKVVTVWCKDDSGVTLYTNYDFAEKEHLITKNEVKDGEYLQRMTMSTLLILLEKQDEIL